MSTATPDPSPHHQADPAGENRALYPRVTSFRARRSALTPTQQRCWDAMWPQIGRDVSSEVLDARSWFGRDAPLVVEIGAGTGTSTVAMAAAEPDIDAIAVEVYLPGIAQLLGGVERGALANVRVIRGDGVVVLTDMVSPGSLTGIRVFFPDPWPKARHHKRRLLQSPTIKLMATRLRPGGILHVATDHADYAEAIAEVGDAQPLLRRVVLDSDARPPHPLPIATARPVTKFEAKAGVAGRDISEFVWERCER